MNISIVANIFISLFIIAIGVYIPFALIKSKSILTEAIELQNYVQLNGIFYMRIIFIMNQSVIVVLFVVDLHSIMNLYVVNANLKTIDEVKV